MKVTLIEFDKPTVNGRIYKQHHVSEVPKQVFCSLHHIVDEHGMGALSVQLKDACAFVDLTVDEKGIYAEAKPFSDGNGKTYEQLMIDGFKLYPLGTGSVNEQGEVENYHLHYVYLHKD